MTEWISAKITVAPIRTQLWFRLFHHQMSLLVRKVSTNLKPIISFATESYLSFLNQELSTTVNTKSGRAPKIALFQHIFALYEHQYFKDKS